MTRPRFVVLVDRRGAAGEAGDMRWASLAPPLRRRRLGRTTIAVGGEPVLEFPGGTIVGPLFGRGSARPVASLDDAEARRIVASRGTRLIERYWGGYVAVLCPAEEETAIVRAPFGELPAYYASVRGGTACASDAGALVEAGLLDPALEREALIRELAWRDFRGAETCLAGVAGLRGGERLTIGRPGRGVDTLWSPWPAAAGEDQRPAGELAARLRRVVSRCVAARATPYRHVLVSLSGGLDSSIVAASLARSGTPFSLATMTTRDCLGDERRYARALADSVGRPLHAAMRDVERIAIDRSAAARLPRPACRLFEQESARIARETAARVGAGAVLTGGGGDNVFCSLQSAAPVADRLLAQGPGRGVVDTARAVARLASASVPAVLWATLAQVLRRDRTRRPEPDFSLLAPAARDGAGTAPHPWLAAPPGTPPGRIAHVGLLAAAESFMQGFDPEADPPTIAPLLAQPVVEACLAIPTWVWFADGLNRAIARRAFERELPPQIARRRSKGSPDSFAAEIFERYRLELRERLLGGVLAAEGIVDCAAIERAFSAPGGLAPAYYRRLLRLVDVEIWARSWSSRAA